MSKMRPDANSDQQSMSKRISEEGCFSVHRQDDNGNLFEVAQFATRKQAESLAARLEQRGHKQIYWVEGPD